MDAEAYADMLPWLVFLVIDRRSGLSAAWAAGCATGCSAALVGWSYWRGRRAPLPLLALAFFAPFYVVALSVPAVDEAIAFTRAIAVLPISIAAFVSLRFSPISEAYTTPLVTPGVLETPGFHKVNTEMTAALGVGSLLAAVTCGVTTLVLGAFTFTFLDWVLPVVIATGTVLWTARRWELFRLGLDGLAGESAAAQPAPLRVYDPGDGLGDAVIRQLPVDRPTLKRGTL